MKTLRRIILILIPIILLSSLFSLSSCVPGMRYRKLKEQGYLPDETDLPNTKWVCSDFDIWFCILDFGEDNLVGECTIDNVTYRLVAQFFFGTLDFDFYTDFSESVSEYKNNGGTPFVHCERNDRKFLNTDYIYENEKIKCTVRNTDLLPCKKGEVLTFEKAGAAAQDTVTAFYCDELDMSLYSFSELDFYYRGEIIINGKKRPVQAFQIALGGYYMISIEDEYESGSYIISSSPLVCMIFERQDDKIVARVTDDHMIQSHLYWQWNSQDTEFVFVKENLS